jgi:hypothetical protein
VLAGVGGVEVVDENVGVEEGINAHSSPPV